MSDDGLAELPPLRSFRLRATCWNNAQCITIMLPDAQGPVHIHPAERSRKLKSAPLAAGRTETAWIGTKSRKNLGHLGLDLVRAADPMSYVTRVGLPHTIRFPHKQVHTYQ